MSDEEQGAALHRAVAEGELKEIERLIKSCGVDVNSLDGRRGSPLFTAENCGQIRAMRLLIKLGAEVDATDDSHNTPLMCAAGYGRWRMVEILLQAGANPNFVGHSTPLMFSSHTTKSYKCAELLIAAGGDPDFPLDANQSALMAAARNNRPELIELLLKAGANPERQCKLPWAQGWTALDHAINEKRKKAREILERVTATPPKATPGMVP